MSGDDPADATVERFGGLMTNVRGDWLPGMAVGRADCNASLNIYRLEATVSPREGRS